MFRSHQKPIRTVAQAVHESANNFSIVIPTLNEAENIAWALKSLQTERGLFEAIVVDGGSTDETRDIATGFGIEVLEGRRGRGFQILEGVRHCQGDIILILHADCRIKGGVLDRILKELNRNPQFVGGAVGMSYQSKSFRRRFLALLNNGRARWTGIAFGDQAQFFRRAALDRIGGFPNQMLMEDVELSLRLKETGQVCYIPDGVVVSQRRWEKIGFISNFVRVVMLCLTYLVQRRLGLGDTGREGFYSRYYLDK